MILRRLTENLKKQNWTAIGIEFVIVILGVFIGTQVANWNQARIEKRETARLLLELRPALQTFSDFFDTAKPYSATTRAFSETAFAGWRRDPKVSDEQFVIAAYQASQIYTFNVNGNNWAEIFRGDRLRDIDDADIRRDLAGVMTFNYDSIDLPAIATPYRQDVRSIIPEDIQDAIRPNAAISRSAGNCRKSICRQDATWIFRKVALPKPRRICAPIPSLSANCAGTARRSPHSSTICC